MWMHNSGGGEQKKMKAMALKSISSFLENRTPLKLVDMPEPKPAEKEIRSWMKSKAGHRPLHSPLF